MTLVLHRGDETFSFVLVKYSMTYTKFFFSVYYSDNLQLDVNSMCSRPVDVIGPVWCKHILTTIYNESLKTKLYLKPLAPIKFADAGALFICNREVLGSNLG